MYSCNKFFIYFFYLCKSVNIYWIFTVVGKVLLTPCLPSGCSPCGCWERHAHSSNAEKGVLMGESPRCYRNTNWSSPRACLAFFANFRCNQLTSFSLKYKPSTKACIQLRRSHGVSFSLNRKIKGRALKCIYQVPTLPWNCVQETCKRLLDFKGLEGC